MHGTEGKSYLRKRPTATDHARRETAGHNPPVATSWPLTCASVASVVPFTATTFAFSFSFFFFLRLVGSQTMHTVFPLPAQAAN
jgi:hypothetical protein